jgi:hypothetical protein
MGLIRGQKSAHGAGLFLTTNLRTASAYAIRNSDFFFLFLSSFGFSRSLYTYVHQTLTS